MIYLHGDVRDKIIIRTSGDACRISNHGTTVTRVAVVDDNPDAEAHIDGFQLIPPSLGELHNQQYAGANLKQVQIHDSLVYSKGKMQGVFCSDGLLEDISLKRLMIDTQSQHKVTLNGLISGEIEAITDGKGNNAPVVLNPLRIGGGIANVWVLSFKSGLNYRKITGADIRDNRANKQRGVNLINFDYYLFRYAVESLPYPRGENAAARYCEQLKELALSYGDLA